MQRTVLELVQDILTETGSDEINSLADTVEATDIATIMRMVYNSMVDEFSLPSTKTLQTLVGLGDTDRPNFMHMPDGSYDIQWIKYDTRIDADGNKNYQDIKYLCPEEFTNLVTSGASTDTTNYQVVLYTAGIPFIINKTKAPSYWTSFDDNYIVFDSYNSSLESALQSGKSLFYAETRPNFYVEDNFTPELPENLENVLYTRTLNRVLAGDQLANPVMLQEENRMRVRTQRNKWRQGSQTYPGPNYGRK